MNNEGVLDAFRNDILANKTIQPNEWNLYLQTLYTFGIGLEETLQFLYTSRPDVSDFKDWIDKNKRIYENPNSELYPDVLTQEDLDFWNKNGYIVLKNAIAREYCLETQDAIMEFLEASLDNTASWYKSHQAKEGLMVLLTKHFTLERNRTSLKIQKAYRQLYETDKIYLVIDKVSFNPPENSRFNFLGSPLHWDVSLHLPIPFQLQGLLYLTDVKEDSGAFHCVPGFHHQIENWLQNIPKNANPREIAVQELKPIPVLGNAGDFIIWHQALPHCATPNTSNLPRMVQYLTYLPIETKIETKPWI